MPTPDQIVGTVTVDVIRPTTSGVVIDCTVEDVVTGAVGRETVIAPRMALGWSRTALDTWCRDVILRRVQGRLDREVQSVIEAMRQGRNPLRDSAGNPIGTDHLTYSEAATQVYRYFSQSQQPGDRIIAAQLTQSLTDAELGAITGLDAAGIQALRDQAAAAIQAASLMKQAGGSW